MISEPVSSLSVDIKLCSGTVVASLRELRLGDAQTCEAIIPGSAPDVWIASQIEALISKEKNYLCFGVETDQGLVAFALFMSVLDEMELLYIAVHPEYLRTGLAYSMLAAIFSHWKKNFKTVHLEVRESNRAARALYEKLGFRQTGHRKNYYPPSEKSRGKRESALLYSLSLI